jgi:hypothetical protein
MNLQKMDTKQHMKQCSVAKTDAATLTGVAPDGMVSLCNGLTAYYMRSMLRNGSAI